MFAPLTITTVSFVEGKTPPDHEVPLVQFPVTAFEDTVAAKPFKVNSKAIDIRKVYFNIKISGYECTYKGRKKINNQKYLKLFK
ncbi:hypothetical protein A2483_04175 [Candidatus Peregrinibacteria bacterium RIFOXYC2_FULL_33_13]|nr:MAG: hypothetical protein A2483_04175 [Candidatus Peregrinibacteria bacterium RIFOXYC2_FULL_33_13]